jgi:hypothetical protein
MQSTPEVAAMGDRGAVPMSMAATGVRQAMDSGEMESVSFASHAQMSFGITENAK